MITSLFVFGLVVCLTLAIGSLVQHKPARRRLARIVENGRTTVSSEEGSSLIDVGPEGHWQQALAWLATRAGRDGGSGATRKRLVEAGFRKPSAMPVYQGARIALSLVLPAAFMLGSVGWDLQRVQLVSMVLAAAALGVVAPSQYVDLVRARRQNDILLGLPDALDLMVVCVEAGLGINASLSRVAKDFARANPTLAAEFGLVVLEVRAGKSSTGALRSLAERTGVAELSSLVAMLVQTEKFGTSLADTLRVQADTMRVQRTLRAEEQAGKAPVKMLFPTLIIFIATLIVTIGPGLMKMFAFFGETAG